MSTVNGTWRGPNIVKDSSLVLYLDASAKNSYNDLVDARTWKDMSGNGYNGTLTNTTYSSNNGGSIVFNGTNSYVLFSNTSTILNGLPAATMNMWINVTRRGGGGQKYQAIAGWRDDGDTDFFFLLLDSSGATVSTEFRTRTSAIYDVGVDYTSNFGSWKFISAVVSSNRTDLYINGSLAGSNVSKAGVFGASSNQLRIGSDSASPSLITYPMQGSMANFLVYNRALTAAEVTQNFNATRGRFGL
jgi:hypothetical protein